MWILRPVLTPTENKANNARRVVGTIRYESKKAFVVVHHGHSRGVLGRLDGAEYDELVVGCDNPETLAASLAVSR